MIKIYECEYCSKEFKNIKLLRRHKQKCQNGSSPHTYLCSGCNDIFYSSNELNNHKLRCISLLKKCNWITKNNKRCSFIGKYKGYCKKHYIDYICYEPNGIVNENDSIDVCTSNIKKKYIPSSINNMINGEFYSLEYLFNKSLYKIKKYNQTNIVMENIDTKQLLTFWENKEVRKKKQGKLITQLSAEYQHECENNAVVKFNNNYKICEKCFEYEYNTSINSLIRLSDSAKECKPVSY